MTTFNKNKISAEDSTQAVNDANAEMRRTAEADTALLANAQERAKKLIESYIVQMGELTGVSYQIQWNYLEADA